MAKIKQRPIKLARDQKRDVRTQFGALCWRVHKDEVQVALVTSRRSRRWVLPKGWPQSGATPSEAAAREAYEEAGIEGKTVDVCLGIYSYTKAIEGGTDLPCVVAIFPLKVKRVLPKWPEAKDRKRKWFSTKKAATLVDSPELKRILREFDPALLPR